MGVTKTFCFCKPPVRNCKPYQLDGTPDPMSFIENEYWVDIAENCQRYLGEPICVANTVDDDVSPAAVDDIVRQFHGLFRHFQQGRMETPQAYLDVSMDCAQVCASLHRVPQDVVERSIDLGEGSSTAPAIDLGTAEGGQRKVLATAQLLSEAFRRACIELVSAVRQGLVPDIAHHYVLARDLAHEMQALTPNAMGSLVSIGSLVDPEHLAAHRAAELSTAT